MGCASSKQPKRCRHCRSPYSLVPGSYSMRVHHPPQSKGDSYHVVALTSTTLGSLNLDFKNQNSRRVDRNSCDDVVVFDDDQKKLSNNRNGDVFDKEDKSKSKDFSMGLVEAKEWSNMIQERIRKVVPKTPVRTPPGEPETINTWELMEGLEGVSPLRSPNHFRSFSFDVVRNQKPVARFDQPKSKLLENGISSPKSMWLKMESGDDHGEIESFVSDFDPEVISTFKKSFQELSPGHPFHLRQMDHHQCDLSLDSLDAKKTNNVLLDQKCGKEKVVVYFTSLRGVRKTYEDCCHVRVILKSLGIRIDERDVSMHSGFKDELKELLGDGFGRGGLPRVFVGKNYIGGIDDIRLMHEVGQLEKAVEGCKMVEDGGGGNAAACEACGDIRFVPCETCSGSCKIYYEQEEEEEEEEEEEKEENEGEESAYGFQRCPDCNENGLIRCPICCY